MVREGWGERTNQQTKFLARTLKDEREREREREQEEKQKEKAIRRQGKDENTEK